MADLFGAPLGIIAKEESNRATLDAGLRAIKAFNDIAAQPVDLAYKQALTRSADSEASTRETALAEAKKAQQLRLDFLSRQQETDARKKLSELAAAQGRIATVGDLPPGGKITQASQASELEQFLEFSKGQLPLAEEVKLRKDVANIKQSEAAAASSSSAAGLNEHKQQVAQFQLVGNIAGAAATDPAAYRALMMSPQRQLLPKELTGDWRTDAPILRAIEMASQDSIKRAEEKRQLADSESRRRVDGARVAQAAAQIVNLQFTGKKLKRDFEQETKQGGKYSPEAAALKKAQTANAISLKEARDALTYPLLSLSEADVTIGQVYRAANGKLVRAVGLREDGKPRLVAYDNPADVSLDTSSEGDGNGE